jgi:hypothetical protein
MALGGKYKTASGRALSASALQYGERVFAAVGKALYAEGTEIQAQSLPLVPVDTGTLHNSSYVTEPDRQGDHVIVEVGFGGPATKINPKSGEPSGAYALYVHENLEAHHTVGQAKYLTTPFDAAIPEMSDRIAATVKQEMSGGGIGPGPQQGGEEPQ